VELGEVLGLLDLLHEVVHSEGMKARRIGFVVSKHASFGEVLHERLGDFEEGDSAQMHVESDLEGRRNRTSINMASMFFSRMTLGVM
jgi:hypothetical protein